MPKTQNKNTNKDLKIQVLMMEYEKLRDEVLQAINASNQLLFLTLTSASIVIPLLVGQSGTMASPMLAVLFFSLSIVYSVLVMNYSNTNYSALVIGKYLHETLEPKVNQLLQDSPNEQILFWEKYSRINRGDFISLFLSSIGLIGSLLLMVMPGLASLLVARHIILTPTSQTILQDSSLLFISSWLNPLSVIAWVVFILSTGSAILLHTYSAIQSQWSISK